MKKQLLSQAFTLVEVTLSIGIAASCLLGVTALLPVGINSNRDSIATTKAASLAKAIVSDLNATSQGQNSLQFQIDPKVVGSETPLYLKEDGSATADRNSADYLAAVTLNQQSTDHAPTFVRVRLSWPADAPPVNTYEILTALNQN